MQSRFGKQPFLPKTAKSPLMKRENLDYSKGLNTYVANDVLKPEYLRYITDARISTLGRYGTRKGCDFYTVPAGETQDQAQTSTTGASDQTVGLTTWRAMPFTAGATGRLTKVDIRIGNIGGTAATGPVIIEIRSNSSGSPSTSILAQSSIPAASITGSYQYLSARFIEAPQVTSGTTYWIVVYIQSDGTNNYYWSSTTSGTSMKVSTNSGYSWDTTSSDVNYKTYVSTDGPTLGTYRAYKSDGTKKTLMAHGTDVYSVNDGTGAITSIKSGLNASSEHYRFSSANDVVYYVNGYDAPRKWDFTTEAANPGTSSVATNIILHKNQMFYVSATDPTKLYWSDIASFESFTSTNFLYVPAPKSPDPIVGLAVLNDVLYIFTKKKKWALHGSDISSFVLRLAPGQKGTFSQDTLAVDRNYIYFLSDDQVYRFNGSTDEPISYNITDKIEVILDKDKAAMGITTSRLYLFYPPSGSGYSSECLVYNTNYQSWESIDTGTYIHQCTVFNGPSDGNEFVQSSNIVGALYYAEDSSNTYNNLGRNLTWEIRTKYDHYDNPASRKRLKRWYPRFSAQSGNYSVVIQYDKDFANKPVSSYVSLTGGGATWGGGYTWGGGTTWGTESLIDPRVSVPGSANYIQRRYYRNGVNLPVEFLGETEFFQVKRAR